ncbi:MAG: O-antigen ligase family protein [Bacteroidetes bacterium]|nr:O-antigen ligase family protein [Bacteroidota bacterium]
MEKRWIQIPNWLWFALGLAAIQAACVASEFFWFMALPLILVLIIWLFTSLDKFFLFTVFITPLSLEVKEMDLGMAISLPAEGLILLLTLLFYAKWWLERSVSKEFWRHPATVVVLTHLAWMLVASLFSTLPLASFKVLATRIWFITAFYFIGVQLFKQQKQMLRFFGAYLLPLCGVVVYTLIRHSQFGFAKQPAHWVMTPFYNDHTHYGAILAMFLPFSFAVLFRKKMNEFLRLAMFLIFGIMVLGFVLSISRAAWLSIILALGMFAVIRLRIPFKLILGTILSIGIALFSFQTELMMALEKNKQESSGDLVKHFKSASNISSDASNVERILRWKCAFRMFEEKPVFGFGPGTYAQKYAPYQRSTELTVISTNFGSLGTAHSEYFLALSEQGFLGALSFIALAIVFISTGIRVVQRPELERDELILSYAALLGLSTYFIHAVLNNFLDSDEASVPFWAMGAILVAMDLRFKPAQIQAKIMNS